MKPSHPRSYGITAMSDNLSLFTEPSVDQPRSLLEEAASMGWPRVPLEAWVVCKGGTGPGALVRHARIGRAQWVDVEVASAPYAVAKHERLLDSATVEVQHPEFESPRVLLVAPGKQGSSF